jgi:hypothetical protein
VPGDPKLGGCVARASRPRRVALFRLVAVPADSRVDTQVTWLAWHAGLLENRPLLHAFYGMTTSDVGQRDSRAKCAYDGRIRPGPPGRAATGEEEAWTPTCATAPLFACDDDKTADPSRPLGQAAADVPANRRRYQESPDARTTLLLATGRAIEAALSAEMPPGGAAVVRRSDHADLQANGVLAWREPPAVRP